MSCGTMLVLGTLYVMCRMLVRCQIVCHMLYCRPLSPGVLYRVLQCRIS